MVALNVGQGQKEDILIVTQKNLYVDTKIAALRDVLWK